MRSWKCVCVCVSGSTEANIEVPSFPFALCLTFWNRFSYWTGSLWNELTGQPTALSPTHLSPLHGASSSYRWRPFLAQLPEVPAQALVFIKQALYQLYRKATPPAHTGKCLQTVFIRDIVQLYHVLTQVLTSQMNAPQRDRRLTKSSLKSTLKTKIFISPSAPSTALCCAVAQD